MDEEAALLAEIAQLRRDAGLPRRGRLAPEQYLSPSTVRVRPAPLRMTPSRRDGDLDEASLDDTDEDDAAAPSPAAQSPAKRTPPRAGDRSGHPLASSLSSLLHSSYGRLDLEAVAGRQSSTAPLLRPASGWWIEQEGTTR